MKTLLTAGSLLACTLCVHAGEVPLEAPIDSVGLFKNGLAYVTRTATIDRPGTYVLDQVPTAVHGTFWVESDLILSVRSTTRMVDKPLTEASFDTLQERLSGRSVTVILREMTDSPITGTVLELDRHQDELKREGRDASAARAASTARWWGWPAGSAPRPPSDTFLVLDTEDGLSYVDVNAIVHLTVHDRVPTAKRREAALVFTITEEDAQRATGGVIRISYLSRGMTWAPDYRINLHDSSTLSIAKQAVIRNEMDDVVDAELLLISGYPSIEFMHVDSPLSPDAKLATFFQQLNQQVRDPRSSAAWATSQVVSNIAPSHSSDSVDAIPMGEGPDLHYESIGRHTLALGDTLMLNVASAETSYERAIEWHVQTEDDDARRRHFWYWHQPKPAALEDGDPWETLRFRNPFDMPMTTAPVTIVQDGRILSQQVGSWVSVGEEVLIPMTKALRVRVQHDEREDVSRSETISRGGFGGGSRTMRRSVVIGTLHVANQRKEPLEMVIRHSIDGTEIDAGDLATVRTILASGRTDTGRYEVTWRFDLEPGETRIIDYEYVRLRPR